MVNESKIYVLGTLACLTILGSIWLLSSFGQSNQYVGQHNDREIARAIYQQDVDHFSNDSRAMSPRDWGNVESTSQQKMPKVTFDSPRNPATPPALDESTFETRLVDSPRENEFRPVEFGKVNDPNKFYENQPLAVEPGGTGESSSSPLPLASGSPESAGFPPTVKNPFFDQPVQENDSHQSAAKEQANQSKQVADDVTRDNRPLESRMEKYSGPANQQGLSIEEEDNERYRVPTPTYDEMVYGKSNPYVDRQPVATNVGGDGCNSCPDPQMVYHPRNRSQERIACRQQRSGRQCCTCSSLRSLGNKRANARTKGLFNKRRCNTCELGCECNCGEECVTCEHDGVQNGAMGCVDSSLPYMNYNPDLGFRNDVVVGDRHCDDSSEVFPFEDDNQYPSMREILAQSVYFAEADFMFLEPAFGGNTAISSGAGGSYVATPFNFDLEPAFRVMVGYESEFGPGLAGEYFQFDNNSDFANFTSDGVQTGETSVYQLGPNSWTRLTASNAGESIQALHSLEVHSSSVYAFKALKFKRAYVNGRFGLQIASIRQRLEANLISGGAVLQSLTNEFEVRAFGPRFGIDYFRKIGHTPLQIVSSATGSILFGDRDQRVVNSMTGETSTVGADEFITHFDIFFGVQARRHRGENRNILTRVGFVNQSWIGGGTAIDPNDDFGFQGISFTLGFNR